MQSNLQSNQCNVIFNQSCPMNRIALLLPVAYHCQLLPTIQSSTCRYQKVDYIMVENHSSLKWMKCFLDMTIIIIYFFLCPNWRTEKYCHLFLWDSPRTDILEIRNSVFYSGMKPFLLQESQMPFSRNISQSLPTSGK